MSDEPLRVLFVGSGDYSSPDEKQALGFAQELLRRGNAVMTSFIGDSATATREGAGEIDGLNVHCHVVGLGGRLRRADLDAATAFRPTLIHVLGCRVGAVAAGRAYSARTGAPLFFHFADDEWGLMRPTSLKGLARRLAWPIRPKIWPHTTPATLRRVARDAAALDALAPALAARVEEQLGRPCALILPILPDLAPPPAAPSPLTVAPGTATLVYAGAITPVHRQDFGILLEALAILRSEGRAVVLAHAGRVMVDPGALLADAGLPAESVVFGGHVHPGALTALLEAADVLVQPGAPNEFNRLRLPSKLQAYLPSGTPTVTFATGFGELLADGTEVLKTETAEPQELARAIARVLDEPELAKHLATGGPVAAARLFDTVRNTDALQVHYRDHLSR